MSEPTAPSADLSDRTGSSGGAIDVHLVDGTYELFRAYFGAPKSTAPDGREVGATRGLLRTLLALVTKEGATHVAVAFDHVIESFRNDLYAGYKTGAGIDPDLFSQFHLAEDAVRALGIVVWPMIELEADDALASGAARYAADPRVRQVFVCSPDKDMAQTVQGTRVVMLDRRKKVVIDEAAVIAKWGVPPASIPDWLALVGDTADGYPGLPRWGEKSASAVLARYGTIDAIPDDARAWTVSVRGADALAESLRAGRDAAKLYRVLATLRTDAALTETLDDLEWRGADHPALTALTEALGDGELVGRVPKWR
ncbi:flap endonuclease [Myxococcota bacterium]|nr:flap endonuclease [Myxococcota bacterium]